MPNIVKCACCFKEYSVPPSRVKDINFCSKLCNQQYRRSRGNSRRFKITFEVDRNGCFICTSHKPGQRGYPRLRNELVFRHVYKEMYGHIEEDQVIRHLCDNKMCINPEHLRKGTQKENVRDAIRNGKFPIGSQRSYAKYDELQIYGLKVLMENTDFIDAELEHITKIQKSTIQQVRTGKAWKHVKIGENIEAGVYV